MKDFIKWLGVNEKIAKVAVWMLIFMVMLILTNTMLESIGFPHYAITYENLVRIDSKKYLDYIINWIVIVLNFYSIVFLVFRITEYKKTIKYLIIYFILNILVHNIFNDGILQIFIFIFMIIFSYLFSNYNKKYILYIMFSLLINTLIQGITYLYKLKFIDYSTLNYFTKTILFTDYFIIMAIIILVKEIYIKKRGEINGRKLVLDRRIQK